jgi:hypothetical protein
VGRAHADRWWCDVIWQPRHAGARARAEHGCTSTAPVGAAHTPPACPYPAHLMCLMPCHCLAGHYLIRAHDSAKHPSVYPSPERAIGVGPALDFFSLSSLLLLLLPVPVRLSSSASTRRRKDTAKPSARIQSIPTVSLS